jgi:hypothetical protein
MKKTHLTHTGFCITSDNLEPSQVTNALAVTPTFACRKGDVFETRSGPQSRFTGLWRISTAELTSSPDIQEHLELLLARLEPKRELLDKIVRQLGAVTNINIWWKAESTTEGYSLPSSLVERLCPLCQRLDVVFDYHAESDHAPSDYDRADL